MKIISLAIVVLFFALFGVISAEDKPSITFSKEKGTRFIVTKKEASSPLELRGTLLHLFLVKSFGGYSKNDSFRLCLYRSESPMDSVDVVRIWKIYKEKYELLVEMSTAEISAVSAFEKISIFKIDNVIFISVPMLYSGSGHFRVETIFSLTHDNELKLVEFEDAAIWFADRLKKKQAPTGGTYNYFLTNNMKFEFLVSDFSGTLGQPLYWVRGHYALEKDIINSESPYRIKVQNYKIHKY